MNFFRKTVLFLVVLSIFAACGSFISQYVLGMNPCVLCILQRLCVLAVGLLAIVTAFSSQSSKFARSLSALLIAAPAVYGAGVAAYQIWLQSLPPGTAPSCGAPWTFRLRDWPLFDWFEPIVPRLWQLRRARLSIRRRPTGVEYFVFQLRGIAAALGLVENQKNLIGFDIKRPF